MIKVSCIIPMYNEQSRIGNVLKVVSANLLIDEIIAVDDGSKDGTAAVAKIFKKVKLAVHEKNMGKSKAVVTGISKASGDFIFLLDADLIGLTNDNITNLIEPVINNRADISISLRHYYLWEIIGIDWISGERVFPKELIQNRLNEISMLAPFGLEVFLNDLIIKQSLRIKIVPWKNVHGTFKYKKFGIWVGIFKDIRMIRDIFKTVSFLRAFLQIIQMLKLKTD